MSLPCGQDWGHISTCIFAILAPVEPSARNCDVRVSRPDVAHNIFPTLKEPASMTADVALVAIPVYSHDLDFKTLVSLTQAAAKAARVDQPDITLHHTGKMTYSGRF